MTKIRTRAALAAIPLALGALVIGAGSASADYSNWGDNGSGTCATVEAGWDPSLSGAALGQYCMQSVTGWIQINMDATQNQAISCANNAPGGSPGLSWSLDGQAYVNDPEWYALAANPGAQDPYNNIGWQTGDGGDADLDSVVWTGGITTGNTATGSYGSGGAQVTNFGGNGNWQAAIACVNAAGASASGQGSFERTSHSMERLAFPATHVANAAPRRIRDKTIDTVDTVKGKAFLAREYALKKNVMRTDTRTCPTGMVRKGKLAYTVQEFPANGKSPKWKNRSLVDVKVTPKGKNTGMVTMTLTRAINPTVVQFQLRCAKA
jgi:hypothetical protein